DRLGFATGVAVDPGRVRIGCVDEVSAGLGVGVEDREALIPIRAPAAGIASQLEGVDVQIGICQLQTCHACSLRACTPGHLPVSRATTTNEPLSARPNTSSATIHD